MEEYYFLFGVALIVTLIACVQDIKKREVSNWLNFSFLSVVAAYRVFYSILNKDFKFLWLGLLGLCLFFLIGEVLYYSGGFGGGDIRLLRAFGVILPYQSYFGVLVLGMEFVFLLLFSGAVYSLFYSVFLVFAKKEKFVIEFKKNLRKYWYFFLLSIVFFIIVRVLLEFNVFMLLIFSVLPVLFIYLKSLDNCMIKLVSPWKLTAGDWLVQDVRIGKRIIKKNVNGLDEKEIELIKRYGKKVLIKEGIPFVPVFLIALIIMVFFSSKLLALAYGLLAYFS